jgi:hypothetical protein
MRPMGESVEELVSRLRDSVGPPVYEDATGLASPPEPRESWIELQGAAVAEATRASAAERHRLGAALLDQSSGSRASARATAWTSRRSR